MYKVEFTPRAVRDLKRLDVRVRSKLLEGCSVLTKQPFPSGGSRIKVMTGLTSIRVEAVIAVRDLGDGRTAIFV